MNAERLHNQARAGQRMRWAALDAELADRINQWQAEQLAAGADPQILAEVVRLVATNLSRCPARRQRHSNTLAGISSHHHYHYYQ